MNSRGRLGPVPTEPIIIRAQMAGLPQLKQGQGLFLFQTWLCTFTFSNRASALLTKVINNSPAVCWVRGWGRLFRLSNVVIINWPSSCELRKTSKTCNNLGKNELSRYMVWAGNITQCLPMICEAQHSSTGGGIWRKGEGEAVLSTTGLFSVVTIVCCQLDYIWN